MPADHLRAGTVKARRPRVCAGGAKRSALHGAEHRCSIVVVMADGVDVAPDVITSTAASRHRMATRAHHHFLDSKWPRKRARTRAVCGQHCPDEQDRIVRTI